MEAICVIIGAGENSVQTIEYTDRDLVIAADGGMSACERMGIEPDFYLGDFDSISQKQRARIAELKEREPERIITLKPEKDDTDTLSAIRLGLQKKYRNFLLYGATGGRLEHSLANLQSLLFLKEQGAEGFLVEQDAIYFILEDDEIFFPKSFQANYISLFAMGEQVEGVTIKGLKYTLQETTIGNSFPIGIDNAFVGEAASIAVKKGRLLVIIRGKDAIGWMLERLGKREKIIPCMEKS